MTPALTSSAHAADAALRSGWLPEGAGQPLLRRARGEDHDRRLVGHEAEAPAKGEPASGGDGYDRRWIKLRARKLRRDPTWPDCERDAEHVHHSRLPAVLILSSAFSRARVDLGPRSRDASERHALCMESSAFE
jgi:hypothetical protein